MQIPQVIGKYEILGRLGAGGMSEVFLARRTGAAGFEKKVALKRLASHQVEDDLMIKSLINEAHLAAQLSHPNLVQVFEFEYIDDAYCMAMEYIDGMTFDAMLNRCRTLEIPVPRGLVVYLALEVCAGLDYAHSARSDDGIPFSLVHRDIKPSNIMISRNGLVKIMDFGIAKAATNPYKTTQGGGVKGTLAYMSPEQISGSESLKATSDLFSLGVILYEASTLERLFDDTNLFKLATTMHQGLRQECRERIQAWFPELEPILDRLLSPDPERRYPDARALMMALRPLSFNESSLEMAAFLEDLAAVPGDGGTSAGTVASQGGLLPPLGSGEPPAAPARRKAGQLLEPRGGVERSGNNADPQRERMAGEGGPDRRTPGDTGDSNYIEPQPIRGIKRTVFAATMVGALSAAAVFGWLQTRDSQQTSEAVGARQGSGDQSLPNGASSSAAPADPGGALPAGGRAMKDGREKAGQGSTSREGAVTSASAGSGTSTAGTSNAGTSNARTPGAGASVSGTSLVGTSIAVTGSSQVPGRGTALPPKPAGAAAHNSSRPPVVPRGTPSGEAVEERPQGIGQLTINADPYAEVYLDGVKRGMSPYRSQVPAGTHQIRLLSAEGQEKNFTVSVAPDAQVLKVWSFKENAWVE